MTLAIPQETFDLLLLLLLFVVGMGRTTRYEQVAEDDCQCNLLSLFVSLPFYLAGQFDANIIGLVGTLS
jgi:hypothetical protein